MDGNGTEDHGPGEERREPLPDLPLHAFVRAELLWEIEALRDRMVFADGLCVSHSGMALADLHNEKSPVQGVFARAGCWPRGSFRPKKGE